MRPICFNRKPFLNYLEVQIGWTDDGRRIMAHVPDNMSKGCQQHGVLGEATLNMWDCTGCDWMPVVLSGPSQT